MFANRFSTWALPCSFAVLAMTGEPAVAAPPRYAWVFEEQTEGVSLWTSETGSTSLGAVKVSTRFEVPLSPLLAVLRDIAAYPRWYSDCAQTRVLRAPEKVPSIAVDASGKVIGRAFDESYRLYFLQHVAVIADRWAIIENTTRVRPDGAIEVAFGSCDACPYRAPAGARRMAVSGIWQLTPLDARHTEVSYVVDLDLKTDVPNFVLRPRVEEAARKTLLGLGARAARHNSDGRARSIPAPRARAAATPAGIARSSAELSAT